MMLAFDKGVEIGILTLSLGFVFLLSALLTGLLVALSQFSNLGFDKDGGIQKFHVKPTSRLGGVSINLSMLLAFGYFFIVKRHIGLSAFFLIPQTKGNDLDLSLMWILVASLPVFIGGLIEDLTHKVTPKKRLILATMSALLMIRLTGVGVERTDVVPIDWLLGFSLGFYGITLLVVAGFTNACNIIDGFHGLASSQIMLMAFFLSIMSCLVQQYELALFGALIVVSTAGFFVWNWPWGKIFLGDGGAYVLGFWVVSLGLMLVHQSKEISPFAPIVVGIYPLTEALFSMYRRSLLRGGSVNEADALHLHSLIFRRMIKQSKKLRLLNSNAQNACVSAYFAVSTGVVGVLSCFFYSSTPILVVFLISYIFSYWQLFRRLTQFKSVFR